MEMVQVCLDVNGLIVSSINHVQSETLQSVLDHHQEVLTRTLKGYEAKMQTLNLVSVTVPYAMRSKVVERLSALRRKESLSLFNLQIDHGCIES